MPHRPKIRRAKFKTRGEIHHVNPTRLQIWREKHIVPEPNIPNILTRPVSFPDIGLSLDLRNQARRAAVLRVPLSRVVMICPDMILTVFSKFAITKPACETPH